MSTICTVNLVPDREVAGFECPLQLQSRWTSPTEAKFELKIRPSGVIKVVSLYKSTSPIITPLSTLPTGDSFCTRPQVREESYCCITTDILPGGGETGTEKVQRQRQPIQLLSSGVLVY